MTALFPKFSDPFQSLNNSFKFLSIPYKMYTKILLLFTPKPRPIVLKILFVKQAITIALIKPTNIQITKDTQKRVENNNTLVLCLHLHHFGFSQLYKILTGRTPCFMLILKCILYCSTRSQHIIRIRVGCGGNIQEVFH